MGEVIGGLVEKHVTEPPPQNDAEDAVEQHVVDIARMPAGQKILPRAILPKHNEKYEAHQVHEPIPAHREWTELKRDRIELGMYQRVWHDAGMEVRRFC